LIGQIRKCSLSIITPILKSIKIWVTFIKTKESSNISHKMIDLNSAQNLKFWANLTRIKAMISRKEACLTPRESLKIWWETTWEVADKQQITSMAKCWWIEYLLLSPMQILKLQCSPRQQIKISMDKKYLWRLRH